VRRLGIALCIAGAASAASLAPAYATPLTVGNVPARFALERGSHVTSSARVLQLVYDVSYGGCQGAPPQVQSFAGYVLSWTPHRLTVTLLLRPVPPPPPHAICPLVELASIATQRITLPHALGRRRLYDGATKPPSPVGISPFPGTLPGNPRA
jgi:hypothetical protein